MVAYSSCLRNLLPANTARMEDSPSGLWRTLGKRVGVTASRVRISYPPPSPFSYPKEKGFFYFSRAPRRRMAGIGGHKPLPPARNTIRPQLRKARTLEPRQNGSSRETTSTISIQHARLGAYPASHASRRAYLAVVCTIGQAHGRKASGQETHDPCNPAIIRHRQHDRNSSHPPITGRRHTQLRDTVKTTAENHHKPRPALDGAGIPRRPAPYATNTFTSSDYDTSSYDLRVTLTGVNGDTGSPGFFIFKRVLWLKSRSV